MNNALCQGFSGPGQVIATEVFDLVCSGLRPNDETPLLRISQVAGDLMYSN